jgi:hypothetical protein
VIAFVNRLNEEGAKVYRRLSPPVLVDLMSTACAQSADFHESLDPFARATFNVSWAGEEVSLNWFDTARELTERWHHQQQIRLATERPGIMTRELYHPVLECFVRGIPHSYRLLDAPVGTSLLLDISGECGGTWALSKDADSWSFRSKYPEKVDCKLLCRGKLRGACLRKGIPRDSVLSISQNRGERSSGCWRSSTHSDRRLMPSIHGAAIRGWIRSQRFP